MKRALAERVKQEMGDPIVPPSAPPSSLPIGYPSINGVSGGTTLPPAKIPRRSNVAIASSSSSSLVIAPASASPQDTPQSVAGRGVGITPSPADAHPASSSKKRSRSGPLPNASSSGNRAAYQSQKRLNDDTTATPKARGPGRPRKSAVKQNESSDEDEAENTSFYLKHQNSALASELYAYRRRIYLLEREREFRRKQCRVAGQKIGKLGGVWNGLERAIGNEFVRNGLLTEAKLESGSSFAPACTGSGTDVETVHSLLCSIQSLVSNPQKINSEEPLAQDPQHHEDDLNNFEGYSKGTIKMEEDEDLVKEERYLKEIKEFATDITSRAAILRDGIFGLLQTVTRGGSDAGTVPHHVSLWTEQIARLETELKFTESKLEEMANARNEAAASERRVRRGLYRLASGRMTVVEVLKAVEKEDNGVSFSEDLEMIDGMNNKVVSSPGGGTAVVSSSDVDMSSPAFSAGLTGGSKDSPDGEEFAHLKKSLQDLQVVAETRDKKITELLTEREKQQKRINSLILSNNGSNDSLSEDSIRKSPLYMEALMKLRTSERRVKELESAHEKIMVKWATVKGDLGLAKKTLADMEEKQSRRWKELITQFSESDSSNMSLKEELSGANVTTNPFCNTKKTAELESKLRQASEAVRRMETLRATLADAYKMNEQLQSKLEDLRIKNAKMVAEKVAAREKSKEAESAADSLTSPHGSSRRSSAGSSISSNDPTIDKLQRDYRRARKEVSAAVLSKDQAKLKQERAERERDNLMRTNARLLKQSSDKDDMNAKSLSTILHLKQRNEELEKENDIVKKQAQAAQQLSLAARLASKAKDRVGEEAQKEKELLDETIRQLQKECESLLSEKEQVEGLLAQSKEKIVSITKYLDAARARCDDLVSDSNKKEEEKKRMMESLAVVKKEATEAAMKVAPATGSSDGVASTFTMEQMTTQVKYLSGRINCPVCNVREKKCILLRCRHMFCQPCVDVNIKNRSRKCPACAQRFDTKDVAEIWL